MLTAPLSGPQILFPTIILVNLLLTQTVKLLEFSVFARKKCFAPMLFGKNERSVLVFPWPSLKTLAQPITIRPFFSPSIP